MLRALSTEAAKLKREPIVLWSIATVIVAPGLSNVFATAQDGALEAMSWAAFFSLGSMTMGTWYGILLFGLITATLFGREYVQGVAPTMLTAPVRREYFVVARLIVLAVWILVLSALSLLAQGLVASMLGLEGFAWPEVWPVVADVMTVALLIFLTLPLVALVAVASRGVFAPMMLSAVGFLAGMMGGIAGWEWLPWAMPTAISGSFFGPMVPSDAELGIVSWAISLAVFLASTAATLLWVNRADAAG